MIKVFLLLVFLFTSFLLYSSTSTSIIEDLKAIHKDAKVPALFVAAKLKDNTEINYAFGIRKEGYKSIARSTDAIHLGSNTKSMTALLFAKLVDEAVVSWNTKLKDVFTEYQLHDSFKELSLDLLFVHRTGVAYHPVGLSEGWYRDVLYNENVTPTDARKKLTKYYLTNKPEVAPLSTRHYSNVGYSIAAYIMEKKTGKSWRTLMNQYIFKPLNMKTCGFGPTSIKDELSPTTVWAHKYASNYIPSHEDNMEAIGPAGRVHCSTYDYMKYLKVVLNGYKGRSKFLTQASFKKLFSVYPGDVYTFGGWFMSESSAGGKFLNHAGSNTMNYLITWIYLDKDAIVTSGTNEAYIGSSVTDKVVKLINDKLL